MVKEKRGIKKEENYSRYQSHFFDKHPPLLLWQDLLAEYGFSLLFKPREIFWKKYLDKLELKKGQKVLDVGCGQGLLLARLRETYGISGKGIDVSSKSIEFAKKNYSGRDLFYQVLDAKAISFKSNVFDFVFSFDSLEHIDDQQKALSEMIRVTKPGGKLLIYTMNKNYKYTLDWLWEKLGFDIFKRAAHRKEFFVDPVWLREYFKKHKCKIVEFSLFDALFTLGLDESIMVDLLIWGKIGLGRSKVMGKILLNYYSIISRLMYPFFNFLDKFWYKSNKSLSFLLIVQKKR